ncbi:hypothetical protein QZH41_011595 [Actinostola sp. cb2023]|nr:hypothetical protein QZH41_011595 [Actinostola sp. cb2023]
MKKIQDLIVYSILWCSTSACPTWCDVVNRKKIKKVVVIALRSVGENDYLQHIDCFPFIFKEFNTHVVQTQAAGTDFSINYPHESLLNISLSKSKMRKEITKSLDARKEEEYDIQVKSKYLLTKELLEDNEYPRQCYTSYKAPDNDGEPDNDDGFVPCVTTNQVNSTEYKKAPVFSLDCEMCGTSEGPELTRISIIDEMFNVVYDTLVMPDRPILDYKTKYSGITAELLQGVTVTLKDVQKEVQRILPPGTILAGHSFEFDLKALKVFFGLLMMIMMMIAMVMVMMMVVMVTIMMIVVMMTMMVVMVMMMVVMVTMMVVMVTTMVVMVTTMVVIVTMMVVMVMMYHDKIIDTSVIFNDRRGSKFKPGLRYLAHHLLSKNIQNSSSGHCSIEDAKTVMELLKRKFHEGPSFGEHEEQTEGLFHRMDREQRKTGKLITSMIDYPSIVKFHQSAGNHVISRVSDSEEVLKTLDSRVSTVCESIPEDCLTVLVMGCGDITGVIRIQKDPEPRREELRRTVSEAKKGLCFLKIT